MTSTGMLRSAQLYIHSARLGPCHGRWMQPWLRVPSVYCEPGPSVESCCQFASWKASPLPVKNTANWTSVSGYQFGDPCGQGECIFHGWFLRSTFMGPKSVPSFVSPRGPVVTSVDCTCCPFWYAHICCAFQYTMTCLRARFELSSW